jgi:hypothetical protein
MAASIDAVVPLRRAAKVFPVAFRILVLAVP